MPWSAHLGRTCRVNHPGQPVFPFLQAMPCDWVQEGDMGRGREEMARLAVAP